MSVFKTATRKKFRYESTKGSLSTEDLWDLPLIAPEGEVSLDVVAKTINKSVQMSEEESFVEVKTETDNTFKVMLDVVKEVIAHKIDMAERAKKTVETKAKKQKLLGILETKEDEELKEYSSEEIRKMIEEL